MKYDDPGLSECRYMFLVYVPVKRSRVMLSEDGMFRIIIMLIIEHIENICEG